jgi:hypothetical protein
MSGGGRCHWPRVRVGRNKPHFEENAMKFLSIAMLAATLFTGLAITGCETHTEEQHKTGLLGGQTDTTKTTTHNDVTGDTSTKTEQTKTPP